MQVLKHSTNEVLPAVSDPKPHIQQPYPHHQPTPNEKSIASARAICNPQSAITAHAANRIRMHPLWIFRFCPRRARSSVAYHKLKYTDASSVTVRVSSNRYAGGTQALRPLVPPQSLSFMAQPNEYQKSQLTYIC